MQPEALPSQSAASEYRLYLLDTHGRIRSAQELRASSDEKAIWIAASLGLQQAAEVWQRARRIAVMDADGRVLHRGPPR